jgi:hypothetical protein
MEFREPADANDGKIDIANPGLVPLCSGLIAEKRENECA